MNEQAQTIDQHERTLFKASAEARLLYARIRKSVAEEVVSYRELSEIIGQDVQGSGRGVLRTAREMAQRDDGIICDAVIGIGIRRLTDSEVVQSGSSTFARIRRLAQRGARRLTAVDYDDLSDEDKARRNASLSALAVVKLMGKPKSVEKIAAANASGDELPLARTLELFRGPRAI